MKTLWAGASIAIVAMLVLAACGPAATPAPESPAQAPQEAPAMATDAAPGGKTSDCEDIPEGIQQLPANEKPFLGSSDNLDFPVDQIDQIIGFVFPDGQIALRAAALSEIPQPAESGAAEGLTTLGRVELGGDTGQVYDVAINLLSTAGTDPTTVEGMLIPPGQAEGPKLIFDAFPQTLNPERKDDARPAISVSIGANTVCYVVGTEDPEGFWRYCSRPQDLSGTLLSVQDTFSDQYSKLTIDMMSIAEPLGLSVVADQTISEMEDPGNIQGCVEGSGSCGADIVGAPIDFGQSFEIEFDTKQTQSLENGCKSFGIDTGVVQVLRPIQSANVVPGQYIVTFWFAADGSFAGATISGQTTGGATVENQPIPAFPATFVSDYDPVSQISAWRLRRWCCWWQRKCP